MCENIITLASAVKKTEKIAEAIGMGEELKADTVLACKLAEKLPTVVYRTSLYGYLHNSDPNAKLWKVFCSWLKREDGIAHTTRKQQVLASDLLAPAAREHQTPVQPRLPNTKPTSATQAYSEEGDWEDVQHESRCTDTQGK